MENFWPMIPFDEVFGWLFFLDAFIQYTIVTISGFSTNRMLEAVVHFQNI